MMSVSKHVCTYLENTMYFFLLLNFYVISDIFIIVICFIYCCVVEIWCSSQSLSCFYGRTINWLLITSTSIVQQVVSNEQKLFSSFY